jgi:hypothetical protein
MGGQASSHRSFCKLCILNLMVPSVMHQPMFQVEQLVQVFREACPLFGEKVFGHYILLVVTDGKPYNGRK